MHDSQRVVLSKGVRPVGGTAKEFRGRKLFRGLHQARKIARNLAMGGEMGVRFKNVQ